MATRSRTTFQKRQKELARMEKQRDKAARRIQRKTEKQSPDSADTPGEDLTEESTGDPTESSDLQLSANE